MVLRTPQGAQVQLDARAYKIPGNKISSYKKQEKLAWCVVEEEPSLHTQREDSFSGISLTTSCLSRPTEDSMRLPSNLLKR